MTEIKLSVRLNGQPINFRGRYEINVTKTEHLMPCVVALNRLTDEQIKDAMSGKKSEIERE